MIIRDQLDLNVSYINVRYALHVLHQQNQEFIADSSKLELILFYVIMRS
jgi:hypothetical protein